jgi:hypothetical protein
MNPEKAGGAADFSVVNTSHNPPTHWFWRVFRAVRGSIFAAHEQNCWH